MQNVTQNQQNNVSLNII